MAIYQKIKTVGYNTVKNLSYTVEIEKLPFKNLYFYSLVISFVAIIIGLLAKFILPPEIPLFYGLPQTTDQLAPSLYVITPPAVSLILITVNVIISINIVGNYLKKTLAFTSLLISILAIIASFKIIFLVGLF